MINDHSVGWTAADSQIGDRDIPVSENVLLVSEYFFKLMFGPYRSAWDLWFRVTAIRPRIWLV